MPDDVTPDWARRFNFSAHSPGGINRPNCKEIFEKVIARPRKVFTPSNVAMNSGTEAETYVRQVLLKDADAGMRSARSTNTHRRTSTLMTPPSATSF